MSWWKNLLAPSEQPSTTFPASPADSIVPTPVNVQTPSTPSNESQSSVTSIKIGVLLDGDADYFTQAYTSKGYRGGRSAALDLRNKVHHLILSRTKSTSATSVEIIAFSFLNMTGLSNYLGEDLKSFSQGFNSSPYAFSMNDVGSLPQAADEAIKSHLPFLLATCDQVLLGGTHDGGYSQTLLRIDPTLLKQKVVLLRTHSFCAERILELGLEEVRFEGLFEGRDPTMRSRGGNACRPFKKSNSSSVSLFSTTRPAQPSAPATSVVPPPVQLQDTPPQTPVTPVLSATSPPFLPASPVPSKGLALTIPSAPPISRQPSYSSIVSSPPSASSSLSSSKLVPSYDFRPLLRLMFHELSSSPPCSRPLRSFVGEVLGKITNPPFDIRGGGFKNYYEAAVKEGLVRLGRGPRLGQDWIELAVTVDQAKALLYGNPSSSTLIGSSPSLVPSRSIPPLSATKVAPYLPLLASLLSDSTSTTSEWNWISTLVSRYRPRPYGNYVGAFRAYVDEAEALGLVETGKAEKGDVYWLKLRIGRDVAQKFLEGFSSLTPIIPDQFLPMVKILQTRQNQTSDFSTVASILADKRIRCYPPGGFKAYAKEAEQLGIVKTGDKTGKAHDFWIKLMPAYRKPSSSSSEETSSKTRTSTPTLSPSSTVTPPLASNTMSDVPSRFKPLLQALKHSSVDLPSPHYLASILSSKGKQPYETGTWRRYLEEAQEMGLVKIWTMKGGQECVAIQLGAGATRRNSSATVNSSVLTARMINSILPPPVEPSLPAPLDSPVPVCDNASTSSTLSTTERSIPPATLEEWNSLYQLHPFSPLILLLDYLELSTNIIRPSLSILEEYLELLPGGKKGSFERAGMVGNESLGEYLQYAAECGVLEMIDGSMTLSDELRGWGVYEGGKGVKGSEGEKEKTKTMEEPDLPGAFAIGEK